MFDIYLLAASASYRNTYIYQGDDVGAVSDALWNNGEACGKIASVKCIGATNLAPQPCNISSTSALRYNHWLLSVTRLRNHQSFKICLFCYCRSQSWENQGCLWSVSWRLVLKINTFVYINKLRSTKYADKIIH